MPIRSPKTAPRREAEVMASLASSQAQVLRLQAPPQLRDPSPTTPRTGICPDSTTPFSTSSLWRKRPKRWGCRVVPVRLSVLALCHGRLPNCSAAESSSSTRRRPPFYYWTVESVLNERLIPANSSARLGASPDEIPSIQPHQVREDGSGDGRIDLSYHTTFAENLFGPCYYQNNSFSPCVSSNTLRWCSSSRDQSLHRENQIKSIQSRESCPGLRNFAAEGTTSPASGSSSQPQHGLASQTPGTSGDQHISPPRPFPVVCSREESDRAEQTLFENDREQFRNAKCTKHWTKDRETGEPAQEIRCVYDVYSNDTEWTPEKSAATIVDENGAIISSVKGSRMQAMLAQDVDRGWRRPDVVAQEKRPDFSGTVDEVAAKQKRTSAASTSVEKNPRLRGCRAIPIEFLQHVPKCFDWAISGSGWEEVGERQLAWEFASTGRARSILEFGGGSGSVSVVLQEGMRHFNRQQAASAATGAAPAATATTTPPATTPPAGQRGGETTPSFPARKKFGTVLRVPEVGGNDTAAVEINAQPATRSDVVYHSQYSVPARFYQTPPEYRSEIDLRNHIVVQPNAKNLGRAHDYEGLEDLMSGVEAEALAKNRELCDAHYQIVDHSLSPTESEIWILRGMLTEPIDFVMADCEGCLLDEFRKNPKLFDYVKTIVVERDDTLEMAFAATGKAVAHNKTGPYNMLFSHLGMQRTRVSGFGCAGACDVEAWEKRE